jgi:hypothetical protein
MMLIPTAFTALIWVVMDLVRLQRQKQHIPAGIFGCRDCGHLWDHRQPAVSVAASSTPPRAGWFFFVPPILLLEPMALCRAMYRSTFGGFVSMTTWSLIGFPIGWISLLFAESMFTRFAPTLWVLYAATAALTGVLGAMVGALTKLGGAAPTGGVVGVVSGLLAAASVAGVGGDLLLAPRAPHTLA